MIDAVPLADAGASDPSWLTRWGAIDDAAAAVVAGALDTGDLTGPSVARVVAQHAGKDDLLVIGPSWPVRHVSSYAGPLQATCIGNRGTSGIDGVMSMALIGLAIFLVVKGLLKLREKRDDDFSPSKEVFAEV